MHIRTKRMIRKVIWFGEDRASWHEGILGKEGFFAMHDIGNFGENVDFLWIDIIGDWGRKTLIGRHTIALNKNEEFIHGWRF